MTIVFLLGLTTFAREIFFVLGTYTCLGPFLFFYGFLFITQIDDVSANSLEDEAINYVLIL